MKWLMNWKIFENTDENVEDIHDILQELLDSGFLVKTDKIGVTNGQTKRRNNYFEITIKRHPLSPDREIKGLPKPPSGKYPGNLFFWYEVKDVIIRLMEWYYSKEWFTPGINWNISKELTKMGISDNRESATFRMFNGGTEFGIGWSGEDDFSIGDSISFITLRLLIKLP